MFEIISIVKKPYFLILLDQTISSGSNFVLAIIYARLLGPSEFGEYGLVLFLAYLINMLQLSSIGTTLAVNIHKYKINKYNYLSYIFIKYILVIFTAMILLKIFLFSNLIHINNFFLLITFLSLFSLYDLLKKYLFATFDIKKILTMSILYFTLIFLQISIELPSTALDVFLINIYALILPVIIVITKNIFYYRIRIKRIYVLFFNELISIKHLIISSLFQWSNSRIGYYVLSYLYGAKLVGIFSGLMSIVGVFNPLFLSLDNYLLPKTAKKFQDTKDIEHTLNYLDRFLKIIFLPIFILMFIMIFFREDIINLTLGKAYQGYDLIFILLIFTYIFNYFSKKYIIITNILKQQIIFTKIYFAIFILNILVIFPLVLEFNIYGWALLYLFNALCIFLILRKKIINKFNKMRKDND